MVLSYCNVTKTGRKTVWLRKKKEGTEDDIDETTTINDKEYYQIDLGAIENIGMIVANMR